LAGRNAQIFGQAKSVSNLEILPPQHFPAGIAACFLLFALAKYLTFEFQSNVECLVNSAEFPHIFPPVQPTFSNHRWRPTDLISGYIRINLIFHRARIGFVISSSFFVCFVQKFVIASVTKRIMEGIKNIERGSRVLVTAICLLCRFLCTQPSVQNWILTWLTALWPGPIHWGSSNSPVAPSISTSLFRFLFIAVAAFHTEKKHHFFVFY